MPERKKIDNNDSGSGVDLLDKNESKNKVKPPSKYQVIYYNDDYTPMDLVVISLCHFFHHSIESASNIMINVHEKGKSIAGGPYSREIADTKVNNVIQFFRDQGYPLLSKSEKI